MSGRKPSVSPKKRKRRGKPGRFLTASERIIVCEILDTIEQYGLSAQAVYREKLIRTKDKNLYGEAFAMFGGVVAGARWGKANVNRIRVNAVAVKLAKGKQIER